MSRRSISRTLQGWLSTGLVKKRGRHFMICDLEELTRRAGAELLHLGHVNPLQRQARKAHAAA